AQLLTLFFLISYPSFASESIFVEIKGDTVRVWNKGLFVNCACQFRVDVSISSIITITQIDTSKMWVHCICYFDLYTDLINLPTGTYTANIYRKFPPQWDTATYYIGSVTFSVGGNLLPYYAVRSHQSECYNITDVSELKPPAKPNLYQNYPNPFNDKTKIQYLIVEKSNVTLKVFDVLGREIATLVNEEKEPGIYEVEFNTNEVKNGKYLQSGLYIYNLKSGKYSETKKLALIK
ncbi:MAG: T9SS type A sorting domain-containing protein, partial [Ignavibacteria bacterium]|nr:T9SS type A sorting domain-containing protein [Ignavibacteria bacterium]